MPIPSLQPLAKGSGENRIIKKAKAWSAFGRIRICITKLLFFGELDVTSNRPEPSGGLEPDSSALVPVIFAANKAEAEFYQTLLADADIQAAIDTEAEARSGRVGKTVAVMVSPELLDAASDIITVREEMEAHILAGPDDRDKDDDEDDEELITPHLNDDDSEDEEGFLFRRDPFMDEEED